MANFKTKAEALASQNYNPEAVTMTGVPEHILPAAMAFINLCVAHDAFNPDYTPDYTDSQYKYEAVHKMGSPSGSGFSLYGVDYWSSDSFVGARLVSETEAKALEIAKLFAADYKAMKVYNRAAVKK